MKKGKKHANYHLGLMVRGEGWGHGEGLWNILSKAPFRHAVPATKKNNLILAKSGMNST